jgi:hypothetical protein
VKDPLLLALRCDRLAQRPDSPYRANRGPPEDTQRRSAALNIPSPWIAAKVAGRTAASTKRRWQRLELWHGRITALIRLAERGGR